MQEVAGPNDCLLHQNHTTEVKALKVLSKLILRRPLFFVALTLMLAIAAAFSAVGVSAYASTREQLAEVNAAYTTVAIPYNSQYQSAMPEGGKDGHEYRRYEDVLSGCSYILGMDERVLLGAAVRGMETLQITDYMPVYYNAIHAFADDVLGSMVLAVRCEAVDETLYDHSWSTNENDEWVMREYKDRLNAYTFSVVEQVCVMDGYIADSLSEVQIYTYFAKDGGSQIFEEGKTYLVRGCAERDLTFEEYGLGIRWIMLSFQQGPQSIALAEKRIEGEDGIRYTPIPEDELPLYAEYEGSVDDFLASDEGKIWREEIIPAYQATYHSVKLMLTDNLNSIYYFNNGTASLVEGRLFTYDEYKSGAKVCLVGQTYAEHNGLKVGDKLTMDLYSPDVGVPLRGSGTADTYISMDPMYSADLLSTEQEYEIVGIYTAPTSSIGVQNFGPNMFFAPKSSVPEVRNLGDAKDWQYRRMPILNSVILKYGTTEQFEQYMADNGWGGCFVYSDQGYSEVGEALQTALVSAERLLVVSLAVFAVVLCVYIFLIVNRIKPSVRTMRIVGVSQSKCFGQSLLAMIPLLLVAVALGAVLGGALFDTVSGAVVSELISFSPRVAVFCAATQFVLLALCEVVCFAVVSRRNLMNRK